MSLGKILGGGGVMTKMNIDGIMPLTDSPFVREFAVRTTVPTDIVIDRLAQEGFLAGVPIGVGFEGTDVEGGLLISVTEKRTREEIDLFAEMLTKVVD